jgi:hypothetical protein
LLNRGAGLSVSVRHAINSCPAATYNVTGPWTAASRAVFPNRQSARAYESDQS